MKSIKGEKEILVVVDNSNNLKKSLLSDNIKYLSSQKNLGYLNGLLLGVDNISFNKDDFIILSKPDIVFNKLFFKTLKTINNFNSNDLIAPSIIDSNGNNQNPNRKKKYTKLELLLSDLEFFNYFSFLFIRLTKKIIKGFFTFSIKSKIQPLILNSKKKFFCLMVHV